MKLEKCKLNSDEKRMFRFMRDLSDETKHEYGYTVCRDKKTGKTHPHEFCVGDECSVRVEKDVCPEGTDWHYTVHTHPNRSYAIPSQSDLRIGELFNSPKECVLAVRSGHVTCWDLRKVPTFPPDMVGLGLGLDATYAMLHVDLMVDRMKKGDVHCDVCDRPGYSRTDIYRAYADQMQHLKSSDVERYNETTDHNNTMIGPEVTKGMLENYPELRVCEEKIEK